MLKRSSYLVEGRNQNVILGVEYSYIRVLPHEFFFSNQIQIHHFEKKFVEQNMNI